MRRFFFLSTVCLLVFCSCQTKKSVDLIVLNAKVYTVDEDLPQASAFAVLDGKFWEVGTSDEILAKYKSDEQIDAKGMAVFPGFIDAHCHFFSLGLNQQQVDLVGTSSFEQVLEKIAAFQAERNMSFIQGRGWDQNDWDEKGYPTKAELDSLYPEIPVVLSRIDGHAYLVNQKALDLAKITPSTKVEGGEIELKNGKLTGILVDNPMRLIDAIIPKVSKEAASNALLEAQKICFDYGLTTVNDAGLDRGVIELIDSLQQNGILDMRVYAMVSNSPENLDYYLSKGILKTDQLNVRSIKVYADGALGSRGAVLKKPYADKHGHFGAMVTPVSQLNELAKRIAASDYQMNTHAIGDSANAVVLRAYSSVLSDKTDRRWKVEHAQVVSEKDMDLFSANIIPSVQPTHATSDMYWAEERLGKQRLKDAYAYKKLLQKAGLIALGTDFPVERVSPFLTFYAAVFRKDTQGFPDGGFQLNDALSRAEALKGMTIWAAYSNFEEQEKGSIEKGKFADFIMLDKDIMKINAGEIPKTKVLMTFVGGKQVK